MKYNKAARQPGDIDEVGVAIHRSVPLLQRHCCSGTKEHQYAVQASDVLPRKSSSQN